MAKKKVAKTASKKAVKKTSKKAAPKKASKKTAKKAVKKASPKKAAKPFEFVLPADEYVLGRLIADALDPDDPDQTIESIRADVENALAYLGDIAEDTRLADIDITSEQRYWTKEEKERILRDQGR